MQNFEGKVAVITGAASGIGLALAEAAAAAKMKVALADVERQALAAAEERLRASGAEVLAAVTDVSDAASVESLRDRVIGEWGAVHLLCNNAGVAVSGFTWEITTDDWTWILGVNLWGVIHGIRAFVPGMLAAGEPAHVVNTASMAGLVAGGGMSPYNATKHAVVAISESMHHELTLSASPVHVSVLCPGWVSTRIMDSERNRPAALAHTVDRSAHPEFAAIETMARQALAAGMPPAEIAKRVFAAVRDERFWILTHEDFKPAVRIRFEAAIEGRNPELRLPGR